MHDAYIRRNILPVVIFQAGNAHKQGAVLVGTDYMAGPFVVEVFVVSFSNLRNVKKLDFAVFNRRSQLTSLQK